MELWDSVVTLNHQRRVKKKIHFVVFFFFFNLFLSTDISGFIINFVILDLFSIIIIILLLNQGFWLILPLGLIYMNICQVQTGNF